MRSRTLARPKRAAGGARDLTDPLHMSSSSFDLVRFRGRHALTSAGMNMSKRGRRPRGDEHHVRDRWCTTAGCDWCSGHPLLRKGTLTQPTLRRRNGPAVAAPLRGSPPRVAPSGRVGRTRWLRHARLVNGCISSSSPQWRCLDPVDCGAERRGCREVSRVDG